MKITKQTKLSQLIERYPKLVEILVKDYGLHCFGCLAAAFETLEEGAKAHGMTDKKINKMLKELNQLIK